MYIFQGMSFSGIKFLIRRNNFHHHNNCLLLKLTSIIEYFILNVFDIMSARPYVIYSRVNSNQMQFNSCLQEAYYGLLKNIICSRKKLRCILY